MTTALSNTSLSQWMIICTTFSTEYCENLARAISAESVSNQCTCGKPLR